jgi:hypothetical protein
MMRNYRLMTPVSVGLALVMLAGCAASGGSTASQANTAAVAPGTARVWFLRQANPPALEVEAARPMVFANGAPIAESKEGTAFFHDFPPGTYRFTVQAYGTPTGRSNAFQLVAGAQTGGLQ